MKVFWALFTVLLLGLFVMFSMQNREAIDVTFAVWSFSAPKVLIILGSFVSGMLAGWGLYTLLRVSLTSS